MKHALVSNSVLPESHSVIELDLISMMGCASGGNCLFNHPSQQPIIWKAKSMNKKNGFKAVISSLIIATGLLATSTPSYSESLGERSSERQEARDIKQGGREQARDTKAACKEGDESRAECRQEKREIKLRSRETARDIKKK